MRRFVRRLSIFLLMLAAVAGGCLFVAKLYLASSDGAAQVAARLERIYGAKVQVGSVDIGLCHLTLRNVQLFELGADDSAWARIEELRTDLTLDRLLRGDTTPKHLRISGATITLHFDRDDSLRTRFPSGGEKSGLGDLEKVQIRNSQVILKQDGRPDFVVNAVDTTLARKGEQLVAAGKAIAGPWGEWTVDGSMATSGGASLTLRRPEIHFTQTMLDELPLVPAGTWKEVQFEGDTPIEMTLGYDPAAARSHYRIVLHPQRSRLRVTAIDLDADQVHGEVTVEDGRVRLRKVAGRTAEGTIQTTGDLDFQSTPERLQFAVDVNALRLRRLPRSWSLPPLIDGKLTGHADLVVTLAEPKARTNGEGSGIVRDARIAGLAANPVRLKLVAKGRGFQFAPATEDKTGDANSGRAGDVSPPRERAVVDRVSRGSHPPLAAENDYVEADLGMDGADMARLLRGLGVSLPVAGRIAWHARLTIPLATIRDPKTYRVQGFAHVRWARMEDLELEDVQCRIDFRDGILRLEDLVGMVPGSVSPAGGPPERGEITGTLRIELVPPRAMDGRLTAVDLNLDRLLSVLPGMAEHAAGQISGQVDFHAPLARLDHVAAWSASGNLAATQVRAFNWEVTAGRGSFHLGEGTLTGAELAAQVEGVPIVGAGGVRLTAPYAYEARLETNATERSAARRVARKLEIPLPVEGAFSGSAHLRGSLRPLSVLARLSVQSPRLTVERISADHLTGSLVYGSGGLDYRLAGTVLDGRLLMEGHVPTTTTLSASPQKGLLWLKGARLARLWELLGKQDLLGPLQGVGDLEVSLGPHSSNQLASATGQFVLRNLTWDDAELAGSIGGSLSLVGTRLRLQNVSGDLGEGVLRAHAGYDFSKHGRGWFNLALERIDAGRLLSPVPSLRSRFSGPVDMELRGTLGADWNGSGEIHLPRGTVFGVEVDDARLPVAFEIAPVEGSGQIDVRQASGQVARGRVAVEASYRWGGDSRLESRLRFYGVQVQALLRSLGAETGSIGTGQLSGQLDLGGRNIRSVEDLAGSFRASLQQTQAAELPVVRQLLPFLGPAQSGSAVFTTGDLEARLAGGVVRIPRCRLVGPVLQMLIEGTATLQGRLDLDATANTSGPLHAGSAEALSQRLPAIGTIPLRLLAEATSLFAGRLMHLHVTGTWRSPIIRLAPVLTLTEEAVRFFVDLAVRGASIIRTPSGF